MTLKVRHLSYALGAEIIGVDIRKPLDDATFGAIYEAFVEHCVLLFRGLPMTREQHIAFSRRFGELDRNEARSHEKPTDTPEITAVISRPRPDGSPATGRYTGANWHSDHSYLPVPAQASLLRALEVPPVGGDTMFCNMYLAYETLSNGMKKLIEGLEGVHMQGSVQFGGPGSITTAPAAAHAVVRVHPDSGRKVLFVNETVRLFVGMTAEESKPLIQYLTEQAVRPQNVYRHRWQKDDLVIWDNRSVLHMALADYDRSKVRHMERTTVHATASGYAYRGPLA